MFFDQDLHVHTNLSLCADAATTLESYLPLIRGNGVKTIGIANHYWDPAISGIPGFYKPQHFEHICEIRKDMEALKGNGIRFLFGAETEYCFAERRIACTEETASQMDFLIVPNSHTHITMPKEFYPDHQKHADYMVQAFYDILNDPVSKYVTAIAHPFHAVCCPYDVNELLTLIPDRTFYDCFDKCASKGIAVEFNTSCFTRYTLAEMEQCDFMRMFRIALKCGCKMTFGSDAHAPKDMGHWDRAYIAAAMLDLKEDQILRK